MAKASTKSEFCRLLFRQGGTPAKRHAYLDTLAAAALEAQTEGKTLTATASGGSSASFMVFQAWAPGDVLELVATARAWADAANITAALALIGPACRSYRSDFSSMMTGGCL